MLSDSASMVSFGIFQEFFCFSKVSFLYVWYIVFRTKNIQRKKKSNDIIRREVTSQENRKEIEKIQPQSANNPHIMSIINAER